MDQTARKEGGSMTKMTDVTEIRDDVSADNGVQSSKLQTMQSLDELNSLKSQLGKTWSELSNIMNKYHAQVIETHEQLEITSLGADSSRILKLERDLKTLRTENGQLLKQIVDNKADIMKLRTENRTMRDEVTMKDTLIEKIQNQMAQEALDYQAELASLKEILEARSRGAELTAPLISSPDTQPAKRRKVSSQQLPARPVLTAPAKRADVIPAKTDVTPVRLDVTPVRLDVAAPGLDVTPVISNVSAAQADVFSMLASSTPVLDAPSTSSLKNESFRKASASQIPDSEQSATEDTTSQDDGGFVKLDEVGDESNLEELEGLMSEQEEYVQGEASALTDGLESGQEQSWDGSGIFREYHSDAGDPSGETADSSGEMGDPRSRTKCLLCKMRFMDRETALEHVRQAHGIPEDCDDVVQTDDTPRNFMCSLCKSHFSRKCSGYFHARSQHNLKEESEYKSIIISKRAVGGYEPRNYQCQFCYKCFTQKGHATIHVKKVHKCPDWQPFVVWKDWSGSGAGPWQCKICTERFPLEMNALAHIRDFHHRRDGMTRTDLVRYARKRTQK